jgi:HrpA-like RNA helicase
MKQASVVVFDEFDERYLLSDIGLALVKTAQNQSNVKFILMSATLNAEKFSKYFDNAPIVEAKGRPFPVETHYLDEKINIGQIPREAAKLASFIHQSNQAGDILIFMPGKQEISATADELLRLKIMDTTILPLHSELSPMERHRIFEKQPGRKIIISTNIAERGITVDGVKFVIDSCLVRSNEYDPTTDTTKLIVTKTAQDSMKQRQGRAGRTQPGECYFLITHAEFNERPKESKPEIMRTSLREVVLQLKAMGYSREGNSISFIDYPEKKYWKTAKKQLELFGALDPNDKTKLSNFGQKLAELSCDPRDGTMLLHGCEMGCGKEVALIAAIRTSRRLLYTPGNEKTEANFAHNNLEISNTSDLLNLANVYLQAKKADFNSKWCRENYISWQALKEVHQNYLRLLQQIKRVGFNINETEADPEVIRHAITKAFRDKVFERISRRNYKCISTNELVNLGRDSHVNGDLIVANEIIDIQGSTYITQATEIKKEWL